VTVVAAASAARERPRLTFMGDPLLGSDCEAQPGDAD
jgi:hypothetical protein